jgi:hypothetical protein
MLVDVAINRQTGPGRNGPEVPGSLVPRERGWATDAVNFAMWDSRILIRVNLAISDIDGHLNRVAYHCTAVGTLGGWPKG